LNSASICTTGRPFPAGFIQPPRRPGLSLKGAYTYSKAINWTDEDGWTGTIMYNWPGVFNRNRAIAGYDIPHMFQTGFI